MGEIRFVGTGETCGYPYLVCKEIHFLQLVDYLLVQTDKPWYNYSGTSIAQTGLGSCKLVPAKGSSSNPVLVSI